MEFNSQICTTKEQSERLIALGLKKETSDVSILTNQIDCDGIRYSLTPYNEMIYPKVFGAIPSWSLDRLICMINDSDTSEDYKIEFYTKLNRYDEAIALIQSLIHIGQFNKEYLT